MAILSNSAGSADDKDYKEADQIQAQLGIGVIWHRKQKPGCWDDIERHFGRGDIKANEFCLIGDRVLTDVAMATTNGSLAVHVLPFTSKGENFNVRGVRRMEDRGFFDRLLPARIRHTRRKVDGIDDLMI